MSRAALPSLALSAAVVAARVAAWALVALVVADAVLGAGARTWLLSVNGAVSRLVPGFLSGLFVVQTPFGGAFRGDFALCAVILFVLARVLVRVSRLVR